MRLHAPMSALAVVALAVELHGVQIAFPRNGQKLPYLTRCYMLGSASGGETNIVIQGRSVPVHKKGGWVTMVDLQEGTNVVVAGDASVTLTVARKPKAAPQAASAAKPAEKKYHKLPYAGDKPRKHPRGKRPGEITVVVDAGHGGTDTGAWSPHGYQEKEANLLVATALKSALEARGYKVLMTRTDDSFPALYDRPKVAHRNGADAFISIHHNAPPLDKDPRQFRYHAIYAWNDIGTALATALNRRVAAMFGDRLKNNGVPHANFAVTRNPEIPSCLVEVDFISTPEGEIDCWDRERQKRVAEAIAAGFDDWAGAVREGQAAPEAKKQNVPKQEGEEK